MDEAAVRWLNARVRRLGAVAWWTGFVAERFAVVEVALMVLLALSGRRGSAVRMLAAVSVVYAASEALGVAWPRRRPFERVAGVESLATHEAGRSFPSRHVASGLAMAVVGGAEHPRLGRVMAAVAGLLGLSRVAAGLHYPSDVAAGVALGLGIGRLTRAARPCPQRRW